MTDPISRLVGDDVVGRGDVVQVDHGIAHGHTRSTE